MIALSLMVLAFAQEPNCKDPQYQAEMNQCAARDFEQADAELNRIWPGLIVQARESDVDLKGLPDNRPGYELTLRAAQRAWITFRDQHCTMEGYEARGGSLEPLLYEGCRARLTQERIKQLQQPSLEESAEE